MSFRNLQTSAYDPVLRRGKADARSDINEFNAQPPFEFTEPPFEDKESNSETVRPDRKAKGEATDSARFLSSESWIVKRGHALSYLGVFLFTFVLYFRPYELIPALSSLSSMAMVLALMTLAIFVPSQLGLEGNLTARPREVKLLFLLTLTGLLSIPFAKDLPEAWATFNDSFLKAVLMFIVMVNVVRTEWRLKGLIWISLAAGLLVSLNALDNYWAGNFTVEGYRVEGDMGGMFGNPNDMALHLVTMIPLAIALLLTTRSIPIKLLYGAGAALMVAGTAVTFSRGGFLGLAFSAVVLAWKLGRRNRLTVILVSLIVIGLFLILAPGGYGMRLMSLFDSNLDAVGSSSARRALLIRSLKIAVLNPVLGVGMGNFHIVSIKEHVSHNAYTQVAAEMGMAAFVIYTMFIVTPLKRLWQIEKESFENRRKSRYFYLTVGMQASLVAYMVGSFFASVAYQWYVYYLVAYAIALRRIYDAEPDRADDSNGAMQQEGLGSAESRGRQSATAITSTVTPLRTAG